MASNQVELKVIVDDDGTLRAVGDEAKKAAGKTDDLGKSTDGLNKSQVSARRNLHGTAQMTSNTTKSFSKMQQGITGGLVPAYAVLASNVFAISAAFNFFKQQFDVQALESSQVAFAENTGVALGSLTQRLRSVSDGMLGFKEAGQAAAIGLAKGFSPKQLEDLAAGARKASTALGRDFQDSFDRLVRGASKAEPELLDELGITLRLETATNRYAKAIGKNRDELNEYERSQAVLIETQRQLNENFGDVDAISNPFIKLQKTFEDLVKDLTGAVMPIMTSFVEIINRSTGAAVAVFGLIGVSILKSMIPLDGMSEKMSNFLNSSKEGVKSTFGEMKTFAKGVKTVSKEIQASRAGALRGAARAALGAGADADSKILQKMKKGMALTPQEKGRIKRSIKEAEAQYKQFGAVTSGMFKGVNIAIVRDVGGALKQTEIGTVSLRRRFGQLFKFTQLGAKMTGKALMLGLKAPLVAVGMAAKVASKAMGKLMNLAGFIGIFMLIKEAIEEVLRSPFKIVTSVANGINAVMGFLEEPINSVARALLGVADMAINAFNNMSFSIKNAFFLGASAVLGAVDNIINGISDGIKQFVGTINTFLPKEKQIEFEGFKSSLKAGLGSGPVQAELSNLAGEFKGFDLGNVGTDLANFFFDMDKLKEVDLKTAELKASAAALEKFKENSSALKESVDAIADGLKTTKDEADRAFAIANAIRTLDISSAFKAITRTRDILDKDGNVIGEKTVMNAKDQKAALNDLKDSLGNIVNISPALRAAFDTALANPKDTEALEALETAANAAAGGQAMLKASLRDLGQSLAENLAGGDIHKAIASLEQIKSQAEGAKNGFIALDGEGSEAAKKVMKDFEEATGNASMTTTQFIATLKSLRADMEATALMQIGANAVSGAGADILKSTIELTDKANQIRAIELTLATEITEEKRKELEAKQKILEVEMEIIRAQQIAKNFATIGEASGSASTKFAGESQANIAASQAAMDAAIDDLEDKLAEGEINILEFFAKEEELMRQHNRLMMAQGFQGFKALAEDFKALGPEGELMGATSAAIGNIGQSFLAFQNVMETSSSKMDKFKAGLGMVGAALNGLSAIQKAASDGRIRALDQEIAAEKKRDGKSSESVARIKELEKKKVSEQRKAFEQEKKMKIAQTIINTATAAMTAYTTFSAFPPLAAAMAAMVIAMGMKQVAMIQSTTFQGGGGGAASGPTSITAGSRRSSVDIAKSQGGRGELAYMRGEAGSGGPENFTPAFGGYRNRAEGGNTAFMVGEQGPELFVPERPGRIVPNDDIAAGAPTNVNFSINAVDAAGVEDLLVRQRGNIIGMIRDAANSYGEDFVEKVDTSILTPTAGAGARRY